MLSMVNKNAGKRHFYSEVFFFFLYTLNMANLFQEYTCNLMWVTCIFCPKTQNMQNQFLSQKLFLWFQ